MTREQHVTVIDRPCGTGKTTRLLSSFQRDKKYLVVVPLLSEVQRVLDNSCVPFVSPEKSTSTPTKKESLYDLVSEGRNVVTTHALYGDLAEMAASTWLDDYHIIIDEVIEVAGEAPLVGGDGKKLTVEAFNRVFVDEGGWCIIAPDGRVSPTSKWKAEYQTATPALSSGPLVYSLATTGCLYVVDGAFFLWSIPPVLLEAGASVTVLTYLADGSLLLPYLRKRGIAFKHDRDLAIDFAFRAKAKSLVTVLSITSLEGMSWSYSAQVSTTQKKSRDDRVSEVLKSFKRRSLEAPASEVMVTCAKRNWFKDSRSDNAGPYARRSGLFKSVRWVANTTRGTNDYADTSTAIYLWDQFPNPYVVRWLGLRTDRDISDRYAVTELVQWLYRTRVRRGLPVTVYIPSPRMRCLLVSWLNAEDLVDNLSAKAA